MKKYQSSRDIHLLLQMGHFLRSLINNYLANIFLSLKALSCNLEPFRWDSLCLQHIENLSSESLFIIKPANDSSEPSSIYVYMFLCLYYLCLQNCNCVICIYISICAIIIYGICVIYLYISSYISISTSQFLSPDHTNQYNL